MPALTATLHKFREYTTYAVAVFFLLPMLWVSYLIAVWGVTCLFLIFTQMKQIKKTDLWNVVLYSSPFFLLIISLQFHGGGGSSLIEKQLSFIVFPICIFLSCFKIAQIQLKKITWIFLIGCCLLALKGPLMYLFIGPHFPYSIQHDFIYRYRTEFNANTQISPTYACMYFGFAIIIALVGIKDFVKGKWLIFAMLGFLLLNMILLSAKMPLLATAAILIILFIRNKISVQKKSKRNIWLISSFLITILLGLLFFTRWGEILTALRSDTSTTKENTLDVRKMIAQCDLELSSEYFITGAGEQHLQKKLDQCYYQFEGNAFDRNQFNSHNQYFHYLLSHGFVGLIVLLIVMLVPLYRAIKLGDPLMISFTLLIMLCMLTENILSRQAGIVFYAFFNGLLINRNRKENI